MKIKVIDTLILIFLFLAIISLNYSPVDKYLEQTFSVRTSVFIERIIDGDTIESDIGNIRLLGINTPERGEKYYNEARDFLKKKKGTLTAFGGYHKLPVFLDTKFSKNTHGFFPSGSFTESLKIPLKHFLLSEKPTLGAFGMMRKKIPSRKKIKPSKKKKKSGTS